MSVCGVCACVCLPCVALRSVCACVVSKICSQQVTTVDTWFVHEIPFSHNENFIAGFTTKLARPDSPHQPVRPDSSHQRDVTLHPVI